MYKRPHHQQIAGVLDSMNADFLRDTKCYFGGGTAIALLLSEYRESVDIDFLCADRFGDKSMMSRDVIDLMVMESYWGPIPKASLDKAEGAYGDSVHVALRNAKDMLRADRQYLDGCLAKMGIDEVIGSKIRNALGIGRSKSPDLGR